MCKCVWGIWTPKGRGAHCSLSHTAHQFPQERQSPHPSTDPLWLRSSVPILLLSLPFPPLGAVGGAIWRFTTENSPPVMEPSPHRSSGPAPGRASGLLPSLPLPSTTAAAGAGDWFHVDGGGGVVGKHTSPFLNEHSKQSFPVSRKKNSCRVYLNH